MTTRILVTSGIGKLLVMELWNFTWDFQLLLSQILVWNLYLGRRLLSQILVWNFYLGRRLLSQILVWDWCHKFWAGIGVTNFDSGAARYAARRSSRTSARGLSSMVVHDDKEECRTDSPISLVCTVDACLYSFRFCIEFGSPTRGDSYACAKFVSTWNGPRF